MNKYADFSWEMTEQLLSIDSPSGFTDRAAEWVKKAFEILGFQAELTRKGGVLVDLGGKDEQDGLLLEAHADTLGCMVATIKGNGRLKVTNLGGMSANNAEAENVWVYTRDGKVYDGTCQLCNASVHVNGDYSSAKRSWDTVEIVLDEDVKRFSLLGASREEMSRHPYIGPYAARGIETYLRLKGKGNFTSDMQLLEALVKERVISAQNADKLKEYLLHL